MKEHDYLKVACNYAEKSMSEWWFPAWAILVKDKSIISRWISIWWRLNDPTSHSEMNVIRDACVKLGTTDLTWCTIYSSMQPCMMCFSAATWANVSRIIYALDKKEDMISKWYYEWRADIRDINRYNWDKIELIQVAEFEQKVLKIIKKWETTHNIR